MSIPIWLTLCSGDRRLAHPHPDDLLQELASLGVGRYRTLLEIVFQEPLAALIDLEAYRAPS